MNARNGYAEMPVRDLVPSAYNPNRLAEDQFAQLVAEVRRHGRVLKPVVVRNAGEGRYYIVDGEHNWRAAKAAGLAMVPVELIEVDDFEARRQTFKRNLSGTTHKVRLGRMYTEMMGLGAGMSGRELAVELSVSEGTVRNMMLYARAAELCAGRDDAPDEDAIAMMGVRDVRALIAQLEGGDSEDGEGPAADTPKPADAEPADLRKLKVAWDKACQSSRMAFANWTPFVEWAAAAVAAGESATEVRNGYAAEAKPKPQGRTGVRIDTGPITHQTPFAEVPPDRLFFLVGAWQQFFHIDAAFDCRETLRIIEEIKANSAWIAAGYDDLEDLIRRGLQVDPQVVDWAAEGLRAFGPKPNPVVVPAPASGSSALPYGINGKELADLCKAKGTSLKAFAERLQATKPEPRNRYATKPKGRIPGEPKVIIPELEALLAQGRTLAEISIGMNGALNLASLLRCGHRKLTNRLAQRLQAYAQSAGQMQ